MDEQRERELIQRRLLGYGPSCVPTLPGIDIGRDIRLRRGAAGLDLETVAGIDNISQALSIALTTLRGSDIFNIDFGFDGLNAIAEETEPFLVRERIRVGIIQLLQRDARVRKIVDVELGDGRLTRGASARVLEVRVGFELVSGEQVSVNLGQVVTNV